MNNTQKLKAVHRTSIVNGEIKKIGNQWGIIRTQARVSIELVHLLARYPKKSNQEISKKTKLKTHHSVVSWYRSKMAADLIKPVKHEGKKAIWVHQSL